MKRKTKFHLPKSGWECQETAEGERWGGLTSGAGEGRPGTGRLTPGLSPPPAVAPAQRAGLTYTGKFWRKSACCEGCLSLHLFRHQ